MQMLQFLALKWQLKGRDAEDSLSLFHTYLKCRSVRASPSLTPTSNLHSFESHGGERPADLAEESSVVELPQGAPSQKHCPSLCEENVQGEDPPTNQEAATGDNAGSILGRGSDLQCKNDADSALVDTKCLTVPPENDCGSPCTPRLFTTEHSSKGGCAQERFSEPPCSEENSSDNSTQFGIAPKQLLVSKTCTLREIHYKVLAHSTPTTLHLLSH